LACVLLSNASDIKKRQAL